MRNSICKPLTLLHFVAAFISIDAFAQSPDMILFNGKVFTADTNRLYVQALAISGNKISAVGSNAQIIKLASAHTKRIDLQGKTVVPGFNDAHDHPAYGAAIGKSYSYTEMDPSGLSKAAVLDSVSRLVKHAKPNEWISGFIGLSVRFDTTMRRALDSIAPNNPVALEVWWGHGIVANARALKASGLSDSDKDPVGGWYIRNGSNKINTLEENAEAPVWFALSNSSPQQLINALRSYANEQLAHGITSIQYMGTGFKAKEAFSVFQEANIPQRVRIIAWPRTTSKGRVMNEWNNDNMHPSTLTTISGIKYILDGTPGEQNSLNKKSYGDGRFGRLNYPVDTIKQILREALTDNRQLMMHITGDSTMAILLNLMKQMAPADVWRSKRVRIEHNSTSHANAAEIDIIKNLGLLMMHTPKYELGSHIRSFLQKGIIVGISPDGTTNPFMEIMIITSQQADPAENISREQAVIAYTRTNAYAEFREKEKGTLAKGMLADLVALSQDIFTIPTEQLPSTKSVLTIVDGKIVYQSLQ